MNASEPTCVAAQEPGAPDSEPVQLELPAMPPRQTPQRLLPRHKRFYPPVHLMADIATTGGFCYLGDHPAEPVLCTYDDNGYHTATDAEIFAKAHALLKVRFRRGIPILNYPELLHSFRRAKIGGQQCSVFLCIFLDRAGRLIQIAELFRGTDDGVMLHPKEITRAALACNGALRAHQFVGELRTYAQPHRCRALASKVVRDNGDDAGRLPGRRRDGDVIQIVGVSAGEYSGWRDTASVPARIVAPAKHGAPRQSPSPDERHWCLSLWNRHGTDAMPVTHLFYSNRYGPDS